MDSNGNGSDDRDRPGQLTITLDDDAGRPGEPETLHLRGDELDLYTEFHDELYRTIRSMVFSSRETAADACSFAWLQFLRYQPDRESNWKGWMVTTAKHEAWRLNAIEQRNRDLDRGRGHGRAARSTQTTGSRSASLSTPPCSSSSGFRRSCSGSC